MIIWYLRVKTDPGILILSPGNRKTWDDHPCRAARSTENAEPGNGKIRDPRPDPKLFLMEGTKPGV